MIIGLTGPNAAGKGEAARYIRSKGFIYYSLSDILREESKKLAIQPTRENLIKLGNELRRKNGPSVLTHSIIKKIKKTKDYIIDSIRNPGEISELHKLDDFLLIGIDAPVEIRFKRSVQRKRYGDAKTLQGFIEKEEKENKSISENQQLKRCLKMADVILVNDSTIAGFYRKIYAAIEKNSKA